MDKIQELPSTKDVLIALNVATSLNSPHFIVRGEKFTKVKKGEYSNELLTIKLK